MTCTKTSMWEVTQKSAHMNQVLIKNSVNEKRESLVVEDSFVSENQNLCQLSLVRSESGLPHSSENSLTERPSRGWYNVEANSSWHKIDHMKCQ